MSEAAAKTDKSADPLLAPLLAGDRRALAQAITLIESTRADHREPADAPSPAGATLGGVARRTREAMLLVEAAGFDTVIVETVGVGQSETAVADMVDMFIVLLLPAGGDDLQGIKRGVIELADLIVVNKADGDLLPTARRAASDYQHALRMLRSPTAGWTPEVATCSALTGEGVVEVWQTVERFRQAVGEKGILQRRAEQGRPRVWGGGGGTPLGAPGQHSPRPQPGPAPG